MKQPSKLTRIVLAVCLLCLAGSMVAAQQTKIEIKDGTVLAVRGNHLVVRGPDGVKDFTVPSDFRFDMDGRMLTLSQLKPGMKLSAIIVTTETPIEMTTTEVREGEVIHKVGSTIVVRTADGQIKRFSPKDVKERGAIMHDRNGNPISIDNLDKGDKVSATVVTKLPPTIMSESEYQVFVQSPPPPRPAPVVAQVRPAPAPKPRTVLPKTGSRLPLLGLVGSLLLALGAGATVVRRFL